MRFAALPFWGEILVFSGIWSRATPPSSLAGPGHFQPPEVNIAVPTHKIDVPDLARRTRVEKKVRVPDLFYICGGGVIQTDQLQRNSLNDEAVVQVGQCMLSCKSLKVDFADGSEFSLRGNKGIVKCFSAISGLLGLSEDDELYGEFVGAEEIEAFKKEVRFEKFCTLVFEGSQSAIIELDLLHDRIFVSVGKSYACYRFERSQENDLELAILEAVAMEPNQSLEPMARAVTHHADARCAPALTMAHH